MMAYVFAAVIYPSLRLLQGEFNNDKRNSCAELSRKRLEKVLSKDLEGDEECGICMENGMKMVLPNCGHSLCISCFHDWYCQMPQCLQHHLINLFKRNAHQNL